MNAAADLLVDPAVTTAFFSALYGTADAGYLALWVLAPDGTSRTHWVGVDDLARAATLATDLAANRQVYVGVGLHPAPLGPHRRGNEAGVSGLPGLFADIDFGFDGHTASRPPPTEADALALLGAVSIAPTLVVHSGHGLHAYWLFREVYAIATDEERHRLRRLNDRLQATLRAAAQKQGWTLDSTADLSRVLRPPGTVNRKKDLPAVPVRLLISDGPRWNTGDLDEALPAGETSHQRAIPNTQQSGNALGQPGDDRPDLDRVLASCGYLRRWRDEAAVLTEPEWHAGMTIVALCAGGERLAHQHSAPYPGYDPAETSRKFARARAADRPLTCRTIRHERDGESYCAVCPLWERITSPIELGYPGVLARPAIATWPDGLKGGTAGVTTPGPSGPRVSSSPSRIARPDPDNPPPTFPVDVFPEAVRLFLLEGAAALGVPVDMIALPLLGFAAGAIGSSRALLVKRGWVERPNLWLAVIGEPGSGKSPALRLAQEPVARLQRAAYDAWKLELEAAAEAAAAARANKEEPPPKPALAHYFTTDATLEALAAMLDGSPGVAVVRDELVGWVRSHDAYRKGGDRQSFLSLWAGAALKVDRKTSGTVYVEHPCVPVVGGIQPELLGELAEEANRRDGFVDRVDMVWPVALPQRWTEDAVDETRVQAVANLFARLRAAPPQEGEEANVAALDDGGRAVFVRWYDENAEIIKTSTGLSAGYAAKYPGKLARVALVLAALHHPDEPRRAVDAGTVRSAIAVVEYLRGHLPTVLPAFTSADASASGAGAGLDARVARVLANAGGDWVARRGLHDGLGRNVAAVDLDAVLEQLERQGAVERRTVETGARPRGEARWVARPAGRTNEQTNNWDADAEEDVGEDDDRVVGGKCSFVRLFDGDALPDDDPMEVDDDRTDDWDDDWESWGEAL